MARPPWPLIALLALLIAGGACFALGWPAPGIWLVTAALAGYAGLMAYGFWHAFMRR